MSTVFVLELALIGQVPLFAGLPAHELAHLAATLQRITYPPGTLLFREGETGSHFYVVLSGSIAIIKALGTADERPVAARRGRVQAR